MKIFIPFMLGILLVSCTKYPNLRSPEEREHVARNIGNYLCHSDEFYADKMINTVGGSMSNQSIIHFGDRFEATRGDKTYVSPKLTRNKKMLAGEKDNIFYAIGDEGSFIVIDKTNNRAYQWVECNLDPNIMLLKDFASSNGLVCNKFDTKFPWLFNPKSDSIQIKDNKLKKTLPILHNGKVTCGIEVGRPNYLFKQYESGLFEGKKYTLYSSGNGHVEASDNMGDWSFKCNRDGITDKKECILWRSLSTFSVSKNKNGYLISVGRNHFPGRNIYLRINSGKVISSQKDFFSKNVSNNVIKSLKNSDEIKIRYTEWPYDYYVDETLNMNGFEQAIKLMELIYRNLK